MLINLPQNKKFKFSHITLNLN